jgi:hypothetical protein
MTAEDEYFKFLEYCNKRDLVFFEPARVTRLRVMMSDNEMVEAYGNTYNDALDNLNIALQARLRRKIDALCEELKELEEMEI